MAVGIYGTKKLSDASFDDADVLFAYSESRETLGEVTLTPLFTSLTDADFKKMLGADGLYKLRLPATTFNKLGFYSVLIKPKTFETTIVDCTFVVTNDANQVRVSKKGIVIPAIQFKTPNGLVGYQIEYFDKNNVKVKNFHRIVTSSDLVSISTNNNTANAGASTYVLDPNGTNLFLTLTPDEEGLISNVNSVDLGQKGQKILISNTFFDPVFLEVEMTDHTIKTLSYALYGNSSRDLETGIYSIFDDQNQLYAQYNLFTQKKQFGNGNIDIKDRRTNINLDQDFAQISQGLNP